MGGILTLAFILYRALKADGLLGRKWKWFLILLGVFFVVAGLLGRVLAGRSVIDLLLLQYFGMGATGICLGYALWIVWIFFGMNQKKKRTKDEQW